jgi:hypothetical protein
MQRPRHAGRSEMIPGSLGDGEHITPRFLLRDIKSVVRRYVWLWIAYQTIKGIASTTIIWVPLAYLWWTS